MNTKITSTINRVVKLEFEVSDNWQPGQNGCWNECPFSIMIPLDTTCRFIDNNFDFKCPFISEKEK